MTQLRDRFYLCYAVFCKEKKNVYTLTLWFSTVENRELKLAAREELAWSWTALALKL